MVNPATSVPVEKPQSIVQDTEQLSRDKSQCLAEGGSWINNSCSYSQQTTAVATISKVIVSEETTCTRNGGTWSNGKCNEESIEVATNVFANLTSGSGTNSTSAN